MTILEPDVKAFFDKNTYTVSYVVSDPTTNKCVIIDPVLDYDPSSARTSKISADKIVKFVHENGLSVEWIIETHAHADHISAAPYLKATLGGKTSIGEHIKTVQTMFGTIFNAGEEFNCDGSQFDHLFKDEENYTVGAIEAKAIHTPGHTPACMVHKIGDAAFVGDTLFMPDYGTARCDFPGGDAATLYGSIQKIFDLPDETRLFMCHDYKSPQRDHFSWETTVAKERATNIHVHDGISLKKFVSMRESRDKTLDLPQLILPSVQVNIRAGNLPPAEDNGQSYLKLPVDLL